MGLTFCPPGELGRPPLQSEAGGTCYYPPISGSNVNQIERGKSGVGWGETHPTKFHFFFGGNGGPKR